jgi:hypothetical protein
LLLLLNGACLAEKPTGLVPTTYHSQSMSRHVDPLRNIIILTTVNTHSTKKWTFIKITVAGVWPYGIITHDSICHFNVIFQYLNTFSNCLFVCLMVFNATFNNISVISWRSFLLVEETGGPGENHRPVASHWRTLSHNIVPWSRFELTTSVLIGTNYIGSCKSNYHTITATTPPTFSKTKYLLHIEIWKWL